MFPKWTWEPVLLAGHFVVGFQGKGIQRRTAQLFLRCEISCAATLKQQMRELSFLSLGNVAPVDPGQAGPFRRVAEGSHLQAEPRPAARSSVGWRGL